MRALVLDTSSPRPRSRGLRRMRPQPQRPALSAMEIETPVPHAPGWALVRPALSGICSRDLEIIEAAAAGSDDALTGGGRIVPGHEVVGVVERALGTRWAREGQRVIVEPTLRCLHKGLAECPRCRAGEGHLCENRDRSGPLCSGSALGSSEQTGGAWSEGFLAHEDMLVPADGISDQRAVLAEPAAAALHAALRWEPRGDRAAVIGAGSRGRLCAAALTRLHPGVEVTLLEIAAPPPPARGGRSPQPPAVHRLDERGARRAGGSAILAGDPDHLLAAVAERLNARVLRPSGGRPVLDGGLDLVIDAEGTPEAVDLGMRLLRGGGTLVLSRRPPRHPAEWPHLWSRELTVLGASGYGREAGGRRTFAIVREWLSDPGFAVDGLVTHRFPLDEYEAALRTATAGAQAGALKVVFQGAAATLWTRADEDAARAVSEPVVLHASAARVREHAAAGSGARG